MEDWFLLAICIVMTEILLLLSFNVFFLFISSLKQFRSLNEIRSQSLVVFSAAISITGSAIHHYRLIRARLDNDFAASKVPILFCWFLGGLNIDYLGYVYFLICRLSQALERCYAITKPVNYFGSSDTISGRFRLASVVFCSLFTVVHIGGHYKLFTSGKFIDATCPYEGIIDHDTGLLTDLFVLLFELATVLAAVYLAIRLKRQENKAQSSQMRNEVKLSKIVLWDAVVNFLCLLTFTLFVSTFYLDLLPMKDQLVFFEIMSFIVLPRFCSATYAMLTRHPQLSKYVKAKLGRKGSVVAPTRTGRSTSQLK